MSQKSKLILAVACLGIIDAVVPFFPILAIILVYVIVEKPVWFSDYVDYVYQRN